MTVPEEDRLARVALNAVAEPGHPRLAAQVAEMGAVELLARLRRQVAEESRNLAQRLATADPARELARGAEAGLRFVVPGDEEWPASLADLGHAPVLHERGGPPLGLWLKGPLSLAEAVERAVAVVGSRSATTYGTGVAGDIAAGLAGAGHTVVSGAAHGIDQAGHRAALAMQGATVAVLACGADRVYPAAHQRLLDYVADVGLVISETSIGGAPTRIRFLARNRLIAAVTQGTVVVEAAVRSGALNTASWAAGCSRVVMGVPGPVTSAPSEGVHQLIRTRGALLVTRAEEVLEAVAPVGEHTLFQLRAAPSRRDELSGSERQVLDAVPVHNGASSDSIARVAGLAPAAVARTLGRLFDAGLVERGHGRWRLAGAGGG
ncbi:MAG: DNA-processing protein DprA [Marmoricola sp.]